MALPVWTLIPVRSPDLGVTHAFCEALGLSSRLSNTATARCTLQPRDGVIPEIDCARHVRLCGT